MRNSRWRDGAREAVIGQALAHNCGYGSDEALGVLQLPLVETDRDYA
jgi:hypothetical protein